MDDYKISMIGKGVCTCGRLVWWIQPDPAREAVYKTMSDVVEIIILDGREDTARCSVCGAAISRPPEEVLDPERSSLGRSLIDMMDDIVNKRPPSKPSSPSDELPF